MPRRLGIVGGLGPLVSAEFLKTVYETSIRGREQDAPRVLMDSDPTFPDRTEEFLAGREAPIADRLVTVIERLQQWGASQIVICCVTMHHVLPQVPAHLQRLVRSLLDVIADGVKRSEEQHLLLCSAGTRRLQLFERHPTWHAIRERIVLVSDDEQEAVHRMIYAIKGNGDGEIDAAERTLDCLLAKYGVRSFIAGCTELHFLAKRRARSERGDAPVCIDPLLMIAREWAAGQR